MSLGLLVVKNWEFCSWQNVVFWGFYTVLYNVKKFLSFLTVLVYFDCFIYSFSFKKTRSTTGHVNVYRIPSAMIEDSYDFFKAVTDLRLTEYGSWGLWLRAHSPLRMQWVSTPGFHSEQSHWLMCDLKQSFCDSVSLRKIALI